MRVAPIVPHAAALAALLRFPPPSRSAAQDALLTLALALPAVLAIAADAWLRRRPRGRDGPPAGPRNG
jgi:hypothetical protein